MRMLILAFAISHEFLQPVARRHSQAFNRLCGVEKKQLPQGGSAHLPREL
jgi:hypothetical protein